MIDSREIKKGAKATPLSYENIEKITQLIRNRFKITGYFPAKKLEFILQTLGYEISVSETDLIEEEGFTRCDERVVILREDVYNNLLKDNHRSRFTAMHELGHVILHMLSNNLSFCRADEIQHYCDPEWQANAFAGAILVPEKEVKQLNLGVNEIVDKYKVSEECARIRLDIFNNKLKKYP